MHSFFVSATPQVLDAASGSWVDVAILRSGRVIAFSSCIVVPGRGIMSKSLTQDDNPPSLSVIELPNSVDAAESVVIGEDLGRSRSFCEVVAPFLDRVDDR